MILSSPCSDTVSRSAIFCAAMTAMEWFMLESVVDIFQVVKAIRLQKPGAVLTVVNSNYNNILKKLVNFVQYWWLFGSHEQLYTHFHLVYNLVDRPCWSIASYK